MTDKPLDLDELDRLEKAATEGPWTSLRFTIYAQATLYGAPDKNGSEWPLARSASGKIGDMAFIAALRNAAPALIAAARERDALKADAEMLSKEYSDVEAEHAALKAKLARARVAAVIAVTPLEAMSLAGTLRTFRPDVRGEIQRGIETVRAILAELDVDQPKEGGQ